jgi:hypothetical protein
VPGLIDPARLVQFASGYLLRQTPGAYMFLPPVAVLAAVEIEASREKNRPGLLRVGLVWRT